MKNCFSLEQFSLLYDHYAFIDVPEYCADQLFIRHQVTVRFGKEFQHPDQPYVIIFCKVRKRDRNRFLSALSELNRKMILRGYPGYEEFCASFIAKMNDGVKALREKRCSPMKHIPLAKQSKRAQKEYHDKQRGSWNGVVPVMRVIPHKRVYDRSRAKQADRYCVLAYYAAEI